MMLEVECADMVREYYRSYRPKEWGEMSPSEQDSLVQHLAEQMSEEWQSLVHTLINQPEENPGTYLEEVGRIENIRSQAQEIVIDRFLPMTQIEEDWADYMA